MSGSRIHAALLVIGVAFGGPGAGADDAGAIGGSHLRGLVWHAETLDGEVLQSHDADRVFNPASVVKLATTLWALERLGPEHRYETRIHTTGKLDPESGTLDGDLIVVGGGDPDFHQENAFGIARRLNELGIRTVKGRLLVHAPFYVGWEGGSEKRVQDPDQRIRVMASRMRKMLDPNRWSRSNQRAWRKYAARHGLPSGELPRVAVLGGYGIAQSEPDDLALLVHRSKTLATTLRRLNCYSNNDIDRIGDALGEPEELASRLSSNWNLPVESVVLESTSGLGTNRMTPRQVVKLLRDLVRSGRDLGLDPDEVLPVAGCDPGTLKFFPRLNEGDYAGSVIGKTGTLFYTDHGVSVLAGIAGTAEGDALFVVAMPRSGRKVHWARRLEQTFVLELIDSLGGPRPRACRGDLPLPDHDVLFVGRPVETDPPFDGATGEDQTSF